ncbi:RebB family R body protein [Kordiimonas lipolytica]|uniref:RebB family R body protein n=1 Tax=Kordiimonas lipolytica TaxID=1662421 RepID=A0ABV8U9P0_9PROT|nr:RebB family R body protein [Kordiimonas lipolytica]
MSDDQNTTKKSKATTAETVTEAVAALNLNNLALGPIVAMDQSMFAQSQAQGMLFANQLTEQQHTFATGHAAMIKLAAEIYGIEEQTLHMPTGGATVSKTDD